MSYQRTGFGDVALAAPQCASGLVACSIPGWFQQECMSASDCAAAQANPGNAQNILYQGGTPAPNQGALTCTGGSCTDATPVVYQQTPPVATPSVLGFPAPTSGSTPPLGPPLSSGSAIGATDVMSTLQTYLGDAWTWAQQNPLLAGGIGIAALWVLFGRGR